MKKIELKRQLNLIEYDIQRPARVLFEEIQSLHRLKSESKKWTNEQLDAMIYILEKHLWNYVGENYNYIDTQIKVWYNNKDSYDFHVNEYVNELNQINQRLEKIEKQISDSNKRFTTAKIYTLNETGLGEHIATMENLDNNLNGGIAK